MSNLEGLANNQQEQELKTFNVYHIEDYGDYSERYWNGTIEAKDLDSAIEEFKQEWLVEEYDRNNILVDISDPDMEILQIETEWFNNGEKLTDKDIEELEQKYDMEISDMLDNFDLEGVDVGYLTHSYEISLDGVYNEDEDEDE